MKDKKEKENEERDANEFLLSLGKERIYISSKSF